VPPLLTEGVNEVDPEAIVPFDVVQLMVIGVVTDEPINVMDGVVQVTVPGTAICASGEAWFAFTSNDAFALHPLSLFVTESM
jgi:hypothetical protein